MNTCKHCGHTWPVKVNRKGVEIIPKWCPKCKDKLWNVDGIATATPGAWDPVKEEWVITGPERRLPMADDDE